MAVETPVLGTGAEYAVPLHGGSEMDASDAITARGVFHRYGTRGGVDVPALQGVNLHVPRGTFLAILGPSGCGKSTLLRLLGGLIEPSEGSILLDGRAPRESRRERRIGWLAQDDGLFPWRTVADNVALPLTVARRSDPSAVAAVLESVGLTDAANRYPHELSGGMRQRAALARALVARPDFLLLDEPFAHLDEIIRERLGDLLLAVRSDATTVLVTHSVAEALRLADRVVVLSDRPGRIRQDLRVPFPHPRAEDHAGFGMLARQLKSLLVSWEEAQAAA